MLSRHFSIIVSHFHLTFIGMYAKQTTKCVNEAAQATVADTISEIIRELFGNDITEKKQRDIGASHKKTRVASTADGRGKRPRL